VENGVKVDFTLRFNKNIGPNIPLRWKKSLWVGQWELHVLRICMTYSYLIFNANYFVTTIDRINKSPSQSHKILEFMVTRKSIKKLFVHSSFRRLDLLTWYSDLLRAGRSWIESRLSEIFRTRPDRPWGPPSLLHNGYRVSFPGVKRPGRFVNHPPHLAPRLKKE
jgi:hypothetical protein